jgi:hypothetical protein
MMVVVPGMGKDRSSESVREKPSNPLEHEQTCVAIT